MGQRIGTETQPELKDLTKDIGITADPSSVIAAGGTPDQAKMGGTPVQVQANIEMQKRAQEQRLQEQEQASAAEQQRLAGETLQQAKAYERPVIPDQQPQAVKIAETLNTLGPVRTRIQSLIQERLQLAQAATTTLEVNEAAVAAIEDPVKRQNAQAALNAYITSPTEDNLKKIYEAIGSEKTKDLEKFFTTPEGTIQESFQAAFEISPTLGSLDLAAINVDLNAVARDLGIPLAQLENMTLDQLNQQIAAIEASELNRVDQLQAQLQDPSLSPAMREAIIAELQQLGASGVIEAEADIEALQEQIDTANTIDILGREMTIEKLLSDEGLSSLVAQAVTDEKMLQALKDDPEYAALGNWIEQNKASLAVLAAEYEEQGEEFVDLQDKYKALKESFGADGLDLLKSIYGDELLSSVTSKEFEDFKATLEANPFFRTLTKKGNEKYLAMMKSDPELRDNLLATGYEDTEIEAFFTYKEHFDKDPFFAIFAGSSGLTPPANGQIFDQDLMNQIRQQDIVETYEAMPPEVLTDAKLLQSTHEGNGNKGSVLSLDEYKNIIDNADPKATMKNVSNHYNFLYGSENAPGLQSKYGITITDGKITGYDIQKLQKSVLGIEFDPKKGHTVDDLNAQIDLDPEKAKDILAVFDRDGDGNVSEQEAKEVDRIGNNLLVKAGLGEYVENEKGEKVFVFKDTNAIIDTDGKWEPGQEVVFTVDGNAFERGSIQAANNKNQGIKDGFDTQDTKLTNKYVRNHGYRFNGNNLETTRTYVGLYNDGVKTASSYVQEASTKDSIENVLEGYGRNTNLDQLHTYMGKTVQAYETQQSSATPGTALIFIDKDSYDKAVLGRSLLSGSYLSLNEQNLVRKLMNDGFAKAGLNGDHLVKIPDEYNKSIKVLDKLIKGYQAFADAVGGHKWHGDIVNNLNAIKKVRESLNSETIDEAKKYNSYSAEYSGVQSSRQEYNDWFSAMQLATEDNTPSTATFKFKKAKLTLKQLIAYAKGEITIDKNGKVVPFKATKDVPKPKSMGWM